MGATLDIFIAMNWGYGSRCLRSATTGRLADGSLLRRTSNTQ